MNFRRDFIKFPFAAALVQAALALTALPSFAQSVTLLNVSYDPTRELYVEFNQAFAKHWKAKTGQDVTIKQSHGGSGKQARSIIDGLDADVATLALAGDTDALHTNGGWIHQGLAKSACHTTARPTPRPSCWWCARATPRASRTGTTWCKRRHVKRDHAQPQDLGRRALELPGRVGIRQAQVRWRRQGPRTSWPSCMATCPCWTPARVAPPSPSLSATRGDVLIAWENEAYLLEKEFGTKFDVIAPSISILAEPAVSVVDKNRGQEGHPCRGRGLSASTSTPKKARTLRASTSTAPPCLTKPRPSTPSSSPS